MSLTSNLRSRARLLRVALGKRFIYHDIVEMAVEYGHLPVTDIAGTAAVFDLLAELSPRPPAFPLPDFSAINPAKAIVETEATRNWASEPTTARFIGQLVAFMQAQIVFEIGCFTGFTTAHIATALKPIEGSQLHILDFERGHLDIAMETLRRLDLVDKAVPYHGSSTDPQVTASLPRNADLIFIDTSHSYDDTVAEIAEYRTRLSPRGILVLHDSIRFPGVRQAVQEAAAEFRTLTIATERGNGLSVLVPNRRH